MRYAIVIEKSEGNYSAYVPDLPGCVATAVTVAGVEREIREAIVFHVEGLREDGLPVPPGANQAEYLEVVAQLLARHGHSTAVGYCAGWSSPFQHSKNPRRNFVEICPGAKCAHQMESRLALYSLRQCIHLAAG